MTMNAFMLIVLTVPIAILTAISIADLINCFIKIYKSSKRRSDREEL